MCNPPLMAYRLSSRGAMPVRVVVLLPKSVTDLGCGFASVGSRVYRRLDAMVLRRRCPFGRTCRFSINSVGKPCTWLVRLWHMMGCVANEVGVVVESR